MSQPQGSPPRDEERAGAGRDESGGLTRRRVVSACVAMELLCCLPEALARTLSLARDDPPPRAPD